MYRTHLCNELRASDVGKEVTLSGWVNRRRDHGGVIFIDLRDRYGLTQVVFSEEIHADAFAKAEHLRSEWVVKISGTVRERLEGASNEALETGKIEVAISEIEVLSEAKTPPFEINTDEVHNEELRLKYRYLDLRRTEMKNNMVLRHKVVKKIRDYFDSEGFLEIETPMLVKDTPEGAREYMVPSRLHNGQFYVLPQSPQQFKQLLMVAGMDKYFQIVRCFRDEDLRGDRQPEFTQLDMEMSFVEQEDILGINECLALQLSKEFCPQKKLKFEEMPRLTWKEAMDKYGSDKPDLRFDMEIVDITDIAKDCDFSIFRTAVEKGGVVRALRVPGAGDMSRKEIDDLTEFAKIYGAKGLAYIIHDKKEGLRSPILKFFKDEEIQDIKERTGSEPGDIIFFGADSFKVVCDTLGAVRLKMADRLGLRDSNVLAWAWIVDFPMFEKDEETGGISYMHHPFTMPNSEDMDLLDSKPEKARAIAYDIVLNGYEIGGGSIRIHDRDIQHKVFEILGLEDKEIEERFGHMLEAFDYGAPPHGGIAWGIDRLIMIFADEPNIREVIAFPKTQSGHDIMLGAPSEVAEDKLQELGIKIVKKK